MEQLKLYTPDEVADIFGLATQTLAIWRMNGNGPKYLKFGNRIRYPEEKILEYLNANIISHTGESGGQSA